MTAGDDGGPTLQLENATVRFAPATDGRGEGLGGMDLVATDRDCAVGSASERSLPVEGATIVLCGTRL